MKVNEIAKCGFIDFSVEECRELLGLYEDRNRPSREVKALTVKKIGEIDARLAELQSLKDELSTLAASCDGDHRSHCPILAADPEMNVVRVNPLVNFGDERLSGYIDGHSVILNPLLAQGYPTISCNRCTTPVLENEPRRAGRWRHLGPWQAYCGINPTDLDSDTETAVELPQQLIDKVLGRETDFVI